MEHTPWKLFRFSKLHHWKVDTGNPDWFVDCGFDEEVAHKVAAASELLEACKELFQGCSPEGVVYKSSMDKAEQAIAKAKGE